MASFQAKAKCMEDCLRIGQFKPTRHREEFREMWADGWAFEEINKAQQRIANERNEIINASQNLRKRKPTGNTRDVKRYFLDLDFDFFWVIGPTYNFSGLL